MNPDKGQPQGRERSLMDRLESLSRAELDTLLDRISPDSSTGHALVAQALRQCGVTRVLGISGTPVAQIFPECAARGIRPIGSRHQHTAVLMAAAANYMAGRLESVAVVSAGPAVTNALTGVLVARDNGWPLIVLGGRRSVHDEGIGYFQELDAVPIYQSVTKWAAKVDRASDLTTMVTRAYETAMTGRPGPVYLDLPEDVLSARAAAEPSRVPLLAPHTQADQQALAECARLLHEAARPLLILGEGIRWSFAEATLRSLVERNGLPFITTPLARGYLPDEHPLCANDIRHWIQSRADLVLMCGACFDWRFRFGGELAQGVRVIQVDFESTTPGKRVPGALTIHADGGIFLSQLDGLLQPPHQLPTARLESWRQCVRGACLEKQVKHSAWLAQESRPMTPQALFSALREFLPEDAIVVLDGSITLAAGQAVLKARKPCSWFDPGWNGCMGAGIPMGMGARLAAPERMVVVVCGDFGFGLSAIDLDTAVRHRIPIIVIVMNNDGPTGALAQQRLFPPRYTELFNRFQPGLRYERIAEVFGAHTEFVSEPEQIRGALDRSVEAAGPACINVQVDPDAPHPAVW